MAKSLYPKIALNLISRTSVIKFCKDFDLINMAVSHDFI